MFFIERCPLFRESSIDQVIILYLGSSSELGSTDKHWYSTLESSGWLNMVRACLVTAKEVTHLLCIKRHSVMLLGKGSHCL